MKNTLLLVIVLMLAAQPYADGKPTPAPAHNKQQQKKSVLSSTIWDASRSKDPVVRVSYAFAKAEPELLQSLFCYCGCDVSEEMPSLLRCFQSDHSVDCHLCREEALLAQKLKKQGAPVPSIQKEVDRHYSYLYPFNQESDLLRAYKQKRQYAKSKS